MVVRAPESFEEFAAASQLKLEVEPLCVAPRDVLAPPADAERHFLVTVSDPRSDGPAARLMFALPPSEPDHPTMRDALWWLAADAWAIKRAGGVRWRWAAIYGYPAEDQATIEFFERQVRQTQQVKSLLGPERFRNLLAVYEREASISGASSMD